jgi:hypothetical protein
MVAPAELAAEVERQFLQRYKAQGLTFASARIWADYHGKQAAFALALRQAWQANNTLAAISLLDPIQPKTRNQRT